MNMLSGQEDKKAIVCDAKVYLEKMLKEKMVINSHKMKKKFDIIEVI